MSIRSQSLIPPRNLPSPHQLAQGLAVAEQGLPRLELLLCSRSGLRFLPITTAISPCLSPPCHPTNLMPTPRSRHLQGLRQRIPYALKFTVGGAGIQTPGQPDPCPSALEGGRDAAAGWTEGWMKNGWMHMGQTRNAQRSGPRNVCPWPTPAGAPRLLHHSLPEEAGRRLTGLELLQLLAKAVVAGLQVVGLRVHSIHALLQLGPLLLLLRSPVPPRCGARSPRPPPSAGVGARRWARLRRDHKAARGVGDGEGAGLAHLMISSCKCSSSEFCSLMKLNSREVPAPPLGASGRDKRQETAQAKTNTGGRGQKA